ncbi:MAG: lysine transporter LysE [Chloroflexota bacterium]|nr:MAG: lysine transporter LysE [Chloroflexota bacterium]
MLDPQILAFIGVAFILTITPGADTMLVLRSVLTRGQRAGLVAVLGICSGLFVHATFSALGLSLIIVQSATAFEVIKLLGAAYLIFLGSQSLWQALGKHADASVEPSQPAAMTTLPERNKKQSFVEGLVSNILNPKVSVFYLAFLPQFINPGDPVLAKSLLLAVIHFGMGIIWLTLVATLAGQAHALLVRPQVQRRIEAFAGAVLILFGVRLALERR